MVDPSFSRDVDRQVVPALRRTENSLKRTNSEFGRFGRGALVGTGALGGLGRAAAFASTSFLGGAGLIYAIKTSSSAASNLNEQISKSGVVFGESSGQIEAWSKTSATALGLARDEAVSFAAGFGALLRPLGETKSEAAATSIRLTQLGADLASFSNTPVPDALDAIRSGLVGEIEPLRRYGVVLSEASVQQEALRETGKNSIDALTAQEKVQARLELIFRKTNLAQGDFARTSGSLANQQKTLGANLRDLEIVLGQALNPQILTITTRLNKWLGNTKNQERLQRDLNKAVDTAVGSVTQLAAAYKKLADQLGGMTKPLELLLLALGARKLGALGGQTKAASVGVEALGKAATVAAAGYVLLGNRGATATEEVANTGESAVAATSKVKSLKLGLLELASLRAIGVVVALDIVAKEVGANLDFSPGKWLRDFKDLEALNIKKGPLLNWVLGNGWQSDTDRDLKTLQAQADRLKEIIKNAQGLANAEPATRGATSSTLNAPSAGGLIPSTVKGGTFVGRPLTAAEQRDLDLALSPDNVAAITAKLVADRKALAFAQKQLAETRGNTSQFIEDVKRIAGEIQGFEQQLAAIQAAKDAAAADRRAAAEQAKREAEQRRQDAIQALIDQADTAINQATLTKTLADDLKAEENKATLLRRLIAADKTNLSLQNTLIDTKRAIADKRQEIKTAKQEADKAILDALKEKISNLPELGIKGGILGGLTASGLTREQELRFQIAELGANTEKKLAKVYKAELEAAKGGLQIVRLAKGTQEQILEARLGVAQAKKKLDDLNKQSASGFTLAQLFAESGKELSQFGSNIAGAGGLLSAQDARGQLAANVLERKPKTSPVAGATIVQNFWAPRDAAQAIAEAANAARALR